ncbi:Long-chain-fatty-acid--CoA ligase [Rhodoplanes serenus]|jgi:long-chain acyl-CoA synthetase|uniref:Long-chain-fatty-acid--CoA ligase n=1 Tax=Rhodoplanes serenus TaxID=200615 RepID=A0A447D0R0_9BRAD|nr:long-chain fatty acid--CoA ligase [Rhodoplanes serenus]MBI5112618.1 long-chain fatty acid--CoA ligase [Rhodovulum sp.]VCU11122.1 Long-chain-fatty-acid--CoA ligase [Rhodoplanes serenus]
MTATAMATLPEPATAIPTCGVSTVLDRTVAAHGDRPAIDFLGRRYTYREVGELVDRAAQGFQQLGVRKGVRVGLCLPNTPYFVVCYYAILKIGGIVVNYNPLYVERELRHQVEDSGTTLMVTLDLRQIYPKVAALLGETCLERVVVCPMSGILPSVKSLLFSVFKRSEVADIPSDLRHIPFDRLIANEGRPKPVDVDPAADIAVLQYTGGTTGTPKGAMLTHANLTANTEQLVQWVGTIEEGREKMLGVLPFFHVFAMTVVMNVGVRLGCELILVPRFDLDQVLKLIARKKPSFFPGVPTLYTALNNAAATRSGVDLSSLKFCISGGAPLPLEVRMRFESLAGCKLVEGYGLSETSPVVTCNPFGDTPRDGSIGLPLAETVVEIRDPAEPSRVLGPDQKGELCVRGPQVMLGYWRRADDTASTFVDGALRTGDIGYRDRDGYVYLVDRIKDVILCGGYNVYPRIVEEALYRHPEVAEVVVIGIPDEYRGQAPKAFVTLRAGSTATPADLRAFLTDQLSRIEMPKAIEIRDSLPKTMVGKLSKKELVAEEKARGDQPVPG